MILPSRARRYIKIDFRPFRPVERTRADTPLPWGYRGNENSGSEKAAVYGALAFLIFAVLAFGFGFFQMIWR